MGVRIDRSLQFWQQALSDLLDWTSNQIDKLHVIPSLCYNDRGFAPFAEESADS